MFRSGGQQVVHYHNAEEYGDCWEVGVEWDPILWQSLSVNDKGKLHSEDRRDYDEESTNFSIEMEKEL